MMLDLLIGASLIMIASLAVYRAMARSASVMRHLVLALTVVTLLALPAVAPLLPDVELAWLPSGGDTTPPDGDVVTDQVRPQSEVQPAAASLVPGEPREKSATIPRIGASELALLVYLGVMALLLSRLAFGLLQLSRITGQARPVQADELRRRTSLGFDVPVLESPEAVVPMTWGVLRPVILLPDLWRQWTSREIRHALLHEHAHVKRGDWLMQVLTQVTCVLYWFHPLVWLVRRRLLLEAERACDDQVLLLGAGAGDYARQLLHLARQLQGHRLRLLDGLQMARPHQVRRRVDSVLDASTARRSDMTRSRKLALGLCGLVAMTLLSQVTLVPAAGSRMTGDLKPLPRAAAAGQLDDAVALLRAGASKRDLGDALVLAAARGEMAMVDLLLTTGADPNYQGDVDYHVGDLQLMRSPLNTAAHAGHLQVVQRLVDAGAEIDTAAPKDANALMEAAGQGHVPIVDSLIALGADVNRVIRNEGTPLIMASRGGDDEIVELLLREGADPDVAVPGDGSPLIQAVRSGNVRSVQLLLDAGADPDRSVLGDENPLYHAARSGNAELVRALIDVGADAIAEIPGDGTALIVAARNGDYRMVQRIIEAGADVNAGVVGDGNPLIMAAAEGHLAVVELLLENGAEVDLVVPGDENALVRAAGGGHLEVVELLLKRGADVNRRIRAGRETRTALKIARRGGHDAVVDLLLSRGALE